MGDWITAMVITLLVLMALDGPVVALLDRRPTCAACGKRQRGALHVEWMRSAAAWKVRSDFWLCNRHASNIAKYTATLEEIAERLSAGADRESNPGSPERRTP